MDTNWKTNDNAPKCHSIKKACRFLLGTLAFSSFFVTVLMGIIGREALRVTLQYGPAVFWGDFSYLPEPRQFMEETASDLLLGYVGTENATEDDLQQYRRAFQKMLSVAGSEILYYVDVPDKEPFYNRAPQTDDTGKLITDPDYRIYCYWDKDVPEAAEAFSLSGLIPENLSLNEERLAQSRFLLAVRTSGHFYGAIRYDFFLRACGYQYMLRHFAASLLLTVLLGCLCLGGRKLQKSAAASYAAFARRIPLELKLLFVSAVCVLAALYTRQHYPQAPLRSCFGLLWIYLPVFCAPYLLYTDLRQNKASAFINSYAARVFRFCREYWQSRPWYRRIMVRCAVLLAAALVCLFSGIHLLLHSRPVYWQSRYYTVRSDLLFLGGLLVAASAALFAAYLPLRRFTKDAKILTEQIDGLALFRSAPPLTLSRHSELKPAAEKLDRLEEDIENAVAQRNRSNRMRVELITNVSHDLKTPLTSIINYADLLCEENLPQPSAGYADSLRKKAYRLRDMVQDVFELSKASSGNLKIEKQPLDLAKLIRQTLADMDEPISASSLTFKMFPETEPVMIEADGDRLYRVFQNLFLNTLQYSLENSRVYIQLTVRDGRALTKIKNTSREELNFAPDEITERFVRGDNSRSTEGSGLGLAIVQSFTEACGGTFSIELDGDLFTACVSFPLTDKMPLSEN